MTDIRGEYVVVAVESEAQRRAVHDALAAQGFTGIDCEVGPTGVLAHIDHNTKEPAVVIVMQSQVSPPVSALAHRDDDFSLSAELRKLRLLREQGVLSHDEYVEVKSELLSAWQ